MILGAKFKNPDSLPLQSYPLSLKSVEELESIDFSQPLTILTGENGVGKSTIVEALATQMGCNPEGGSRNFKFASLETHSNLHEHIRIARDYRPINDVFFYRAETYYNFATEMKRLDDAPSFSPEIRTFYGGDRLHDLSHGQSVIQLFRHRFKKDGVYFLDEPEAALSPNRQLECVAWLHQLCKKGAQFVIATHSPLILATPGARIYELTEQGVRESSYDDLTGILIYRRVLAERQAYMAQVINPEDE